MYKQCRTEQSSQRQRVLEQGLLEMMLRKNFEEISVSDLCDDLEIPRKSFYRYFSSKEGALHALVDHAILDYNSYVLPVDAFEKHTPLQVMERVFTYWKNNSRLLDALAKSGLSGVLIERTVANSERELVVNRFMPEDEIVVRRYGVTYSVCGMMMMMVRWHHEGFQQSVEQMAQIALRLMNEPLLE